MVLEPLPQRVLPVGGLHGSELRRLAHQFGGLVLQADQTRQGVGVVDARRDDAEFAAHVRHPVPQRRRRTDRRGGRVVQLVCQTGRQRPQRQQPLPLVDDLLAALLTEEQSLEHVDRHGEPLSNQVSEPLGVEHEEPGRTRHVHARHVLLRGAVPEVRLPRTRVDAPRRRAVHLDLLAAGHLGQHQFPVEEHVEARGVVALREHGTGLDHLHVPVGTQLLELLVVERLEEEQRLQFLGAAVEFGHDDPASGTRAVVRVGRDSGGRA